MTQAFSSQLYCLESNFIVWDRTLLSVDNGTVPSLAAYSTVTDLARLRG